MTSREIITIPLIATFLISCGSTKSDNQKFEEQAANDIHLLDTTTLRFLQGWDYVRRGNASFWSRLSGDSFLYKCSFYPSIDSPKLTTYQVHNFAKYFEANLQVDTSYGAIEFIKIGGTNLNLIGTDHLGQNIILATNLSFLKTFPKGNPFDTLSKLTGLKEKLNVIGIEHSDNLGGLSNSIFQMDNTY